MTRLFSRRRALLLVLALCLPAGWGAASAQILLEQISGLAFTPDGQGLMVSASGALMVYRDGRWRTLPAAPQGISGLSVTARAIYATAHGSGLLKSTDGGLTWQGLVSFGEAKVRLMAASFRTRTLYLINPAQNPLMPQPGLYRSQDEGQSWQSAAGQNAPSPVSSIAVHPADAATVALGTIGGVYVSRDSGATFRHLSGKAVTAVLFDLAGEHVYLARQGISAVERAGLAADGVRSLALPVASRDFITYIGQNPARSQDLAVATQLGSVFVSRNGGRTWRAVAREGRPA